MAGVIHASPFSRRGGIMMNFDERLDKVNENISLIQKKNGLTFGSDAYLLYAYMRAKKNAYAADLGAGTGVISLLSLAKRKFSFVYAVEVQESFADLIARNALENKLDSSMQVVCCDVRDLSAKDFGRELDVVFSNPPYMTKDSGFQNRDSEKYIARHEVFGTIKDFCSAASRILKYGGSFYVVYRPDRLVDLLFALREASLEPKRMTYVYADSEHSPSLVLIEAKKGGASGLFLTKPLLLKNSDGTDSPDMKYIYENGVFHEQYDKP
ncbi:MAG: methyltransferase [Clostridia bacterium]|nr:methyltransferase [Clostridia bacterium]